MGVIENMLAMDYHAMTMTGHDLPENVNVIGLISNGFEDLGVQPTLGRGLLRSDAIDGQEPQPVAVVSYKFWQERLGADPRVVGKNLELDRKSYAIVGVAAPRFKWYNADVYLPLKMTADPAHFCIVDFRLRPGVKHQAADAALQPLLEQFAKEMPKHFPEHFKVQVEGLNEWVERDMSGTLYLLLGAVGLLLAIRVRKCVDSPAGVGHGAAARICRAGRGGSAEPPHCTPTAYRVDPVGSDWRGAGAGSAGVLWNFGDDQVGIAAVCFRAGGGDSHQSSGAGLQRYSGGGNDADVRTVAGGTVVANAGGPDHGVEYPPCGGQRARPKSPPCADHTANCTDAGAIGGGGLGDEELPEIDEYAARLRSAPCDVGGDSAARELVHHVGSARRIF